MKHAWLLTVGLALAASCGTASGQDFTNVLDGSTLPGNSGWTVDGQGGTLVDLGGGNSGIQQTDDDTGGGAGIHGASYDEYYITIFDAANTLAASKMVM
jgi:hypothetical protein